VTKDNFVGYVHSRQNGLATVLVTDTDYPSRVAFNILQKVVMDMDEQYKEKSTKFDAVRKDFELNDMYLETLKKIVEEYQDPVKTDKILKVKKDLEETKTILNSALDSLLDRGEKLDTLVAKTDMLNDSAKDFYIKAKENNSCCTIL
jgi:synaptobrevin family protein YKT6